MNAGGYRRTACTAAALVIAAVTPGRLHHIGDRSSDSGFRSLDKRQACTCNGFGSQAEYAESVDVYNDALNAHDVVWNGFSAVYNCHGDVMGVSPAGEFGPMRLSFFGTPSDGVLVWTMSRSDWTCD